MRSPCSIRRPHISCFSSAHRCACTAFNRILHLLTSDDTHMVFNRITHASHRVHRRGPDQGLDQMKQNYNNTNTFPHHHHHQHNNTRSLCVSPGCSLEPGAPKERQMQSYYKRRGHFNTTSKGLTAAAGTPKAARVCGPLQEECQESSVDSRRGGEPLQQMGSSSGSHV